MWISATLRLFRKMDCIAQEMEREEGEGVQGRVRPEGEEEGGQGHQEQDDGQGVEVPELQVGIVQHNNLIITKMLSVQVKYFRDNLDAEIWECGNGHGFCGDCVDKENAGGGEDELEIGEDGIFR